jgi:hypothetical protein
MRLIAFVPALVVSFSCKNPLMVETAKLDVPSLDEVVVTFVRSSIMAPTVKGGLWDRERFIGEIKARSLVQYKTTPGKHLFLASSETWSYLEANLQGGRHYVVKAEVVPGGNSARLNLAPVVPGGRKTKEDIAKWLDDLDGYKPSKEQTEEYLRVHLGALKRAVERYDMGRIVAETLSPQDAW